MGSIVRRGTTSTFLLALQAVVVLMLAGAAHAQGFQPPPYGAATPSPSSDSVYLSSGMFRDLFGPIPNLQVGYLYSFGSNVRTGRLTLNYVLPISLSAGSVVFGEAHTEFTDFWKTLRGGVNSRVDASFGGGYRTLLGDKMLVGVNAFYDSARLAGTWYASGGLGFKMAAMLPGNDALDLNFNWYGNLFSRSVILNAFRTGPTNYDFQAGYSHELWNGGPDFRLSATGYRFEVGTPVWGWNAGAELKSRDGMFVLRYQVGSDRINQTYQTVGAYVNVGLRLENLTRGESPFTMPEPIFKSPRNLSRLLSEKVKRNFHQPAAVILAQQAQQSGKAGGHSPVPPTFAFVLVDKTNGWVPLDVPFDQPAGVSINELSWPQADQSATATSYSVAILDPDGLIPTPTVSVTLTPGNFVNLAGINVRPDVASYNLPHTISVARDGTPTVVVRTTASGTPGAISTATGTSASGTITIVGAGVQTLVINVHTR